MRIVIVLIVGLTLIFMVSVGWYVSLPVVVGVARAIKSTVTDSNAINIITFVEYAAYLWGPILLSFIGLWMVISAGKRDVESERYG